ncbi:MAG: hypothetical protein ACPHR0_03305 [Candidatus Puniceispirillaceae bacterium]
MNKLRTRWAASIAGLAVTSCVHAAEINFDLHAIDTPGAATDTGAFRHIIRNQAKTSRTALGIVESITQQYPRHTRFTSMRTLDLLFLQAQLPHFLQRAPTL